MTLKTISPEEAKLEVSKSKGRIVLIAIQDLSETDVNIAFDRHDKADCDRIIESAKTITKMCDDFIKMLDCYTEEQDIEDIKPVGLQQTILLIKED